jgi:hypothetical protein
VKKGPIGICGCAAIHRHRLAERPWGLTPKWLTCLMRSQCQGSLSTRRVTFDPVDGLDALALSHHSGARAYGAGGAESLFSVVPTISFSLGISSLRWLLGLGRVAAYQHRVPS